MGEKAISKGVTVRERDGVPMQQQLWSRHGHGTRIFPEAAYAHQTYLGDVDAVSDSERQGVTVGSP